MDPLRARAVFFVKDAGAALAFYTQTLGFTLEWNHQVEGRPFVFEVALFGFKLILNQVEDWTKDRAGHGRVFIGLSPDQLPPFRDHLLAREIQATRFQWGNPTLAVKDPDGNELFFWPPQGEWAALESLCGAAR